MNPEPQVARQAHQIRQAPLQTLQQDRDHACEAQGLATGGNALRQMPEGLRLFCHPRRNRPLLTLIINES